MTFCQKLTGCAEANNSLVCVGLDTDPEKLPAQFPRTAEGVVAFNREIIKATSNIVCAYKPNAAFYEAMGSEGIDALVKTCEAIPVAIPVILDVKRGDIGTTAERYAAAAYDIIGADAVTVNPYMGFDAVKPFLREDKGVFVLCVTSNPSADDFQMLSSEGVPLYEHVATRAVAWSEEGDIGIVMGATRPEVMASIRNLVGDMPILVPGIGAQGGDLESVIRECDAWPGTTIINSSRGILYASGGEDFAEAARSACERLRGDINGFMRWER